MCTMDYKLVIDNILKSTECGCTDSAYNNAELLNTISKKIYNKSSLDSGDIDILKDILSICNILYNNTDRDHLPIDDGFYDLLLEKYRKYNPNFQVGSKIVSFDPSNKSSIINPNKCRRLITFVDKNEFKDKMFFNDIVVDPTRYIDSRDFEHSSSGSTDYISKRKHDTIHEHPELIGTLDKCKFVLDLDAMERGVYTDSNVKILERDFFQNHLMNGIITPNQSFDMILELKYDGVSVEADCSGELISARSRGDVAIGKASDLTPLLKGYRFPHRDINAPIVGVKFEAIITNDDLYRFNMARGYEYKNGRSAIVGLMASSDAWKYREFITLVPLAVESSVYHNECQSDRLREIDYLNTYFVSKGCPLRYTIVNGTYKENLVWINMFVQNAENLRYMVPFMYDGVVVSYRDESIRQKLGRENFINKFSMAIKFNPLRRTTTFRGYTYTVGQDGSITPMIHYDPVEFYGTIHDKSSGHSYARFNELQLHNGDLINVEYVNDVMPYVTKPFSDFNIQNDQIFPLEKFPEQCPICGSPLMISPSKKSVKCTNIQCGGRALSRMVNTCQKLGLDGFGESTIIQIGAYHLSEMIQMFLSDNWYNILQSKGFGPTESINLINQIDGLIHKPIVETQLFGAIGFSGISTKTWELILSHVSYDDIRLLGNNDNMTVYTKLKPIKGIGPATIDTIRTEMEYFRDDLDWMYTNANVQRFVYTKRKKIKVSGFRDPDFERYLCSIGFDVDDGAVTKDTSYLLIPDVSYSSSKTKRANDLGIPIVLVQEFRDNISRYL